MLDDDALRALAVVDRAGMLRLGSYVEARAAVDYLADYARWTVPEADRVIGEAVAIAGTMGDSRDANLLARALSPGGFRALYRVTHPLKLR